MKLVAIFILFIALLATGVPSSCTTACANEQTEHATSTNKHSDKEDESHQCYCCCSFCHIVLAYNKSSIEIIKRIKPIDAKVYFTLNQSFASQDQQAIWQPPKTSV